MIYDMIWDIIWYESNDLQLGFFCFFDDVGPTGHPEPWILRLPQNARSNIRNPQESLTHHSSDPQLT